MNGSNRSRVAREGNFANGIGRMLGYVLLVAAALLCTLISQRSLAQSAPPPAPASLIVKFSPGLSASDQDAIIARVGGVEISSIPALRLRVVEVPADQRDEILSNYQSDPGVARAEVNKARKSGALPTDPRYAEQWSLPKIGWDQVFGNAVPGASVVVAILDTGIDATHPDLGSNVVAGTSILDGSTGMSDPSGHGTRVAGIVAAQTNTSPAQGIAGVAYAGVRLMPITVLDAQGLGQDSDIIAGVVWAADNGADVILMAFSNPDYSESLQEAIDYAWSKEVLLVAAVGNDGVTAPSFPAGDRGVVGVSATDANDQLASFSNSGASVFLAAPGVSLLTTDIAGTYSTMSGTSGAAAIVAGAAAQLWAIDPTLTNGVIAGRLARTADAAGTQDQTGNGRINFARALLDTGTDFIQPAGSAPVGSGGPFVGPYRAAACTVSSLSVVAQSPAQAFSGDTVSYNAITLTKSNGNCSGNWTLSWSAGNPPAGVGTSLSSTAFTGSGTSKTTSLTITTSASTPAGSYGFTVTAGGSDTGGTVTSLAYTLTIAKRLPTITFGAAPASTYLGGNFIVSATTTNTDSSTLTYSVVAGPCALVSGATFSSTGAGTCTVKASGAETANFQAASSTQDVAIAKATPTITFGAAPTPTYLGGNFAVGATTTNTDSATLTYSALSGPCALASGATFSSSGAGTCKVQASGAATTNFNAATATQDVTIAKASQTITFGVLAAKSFGDPDFSVSATATSGLTVTFAATGNCTSAGSSVHITGAGSCTITAKQAGDANFNAAPDVPQTFTIAKGNQTITFGALTAKTFGDPDFGVGATASSGLAVTFVASGSCTIAGSSVHITGAGSCTVTAKQAGDANYNAATDVPQSFTINKGSQTITFGALAAKTFGDPDFSVGASASSGLTVTFTASGNCTIAGTSAHITGAGSCTITAKQAGDANYNAATDVPQTFPIAKAASTTAVVVANVTYDGAQHGGTASVTGAGALNQPLDITYTGINGTTYAASTTAPTNAGDYQATASFGGDANHLSSSDTKNFTINKAASTTVVTIANASFDGNPHGGTAAVTGIGGLNQSLAVTYSGINGTTYGPATSAPTNAGDYRAEATYEGDANHTGSSDARNFTIAKAASVTVVTVAGGTSFSYDGLAHPATVSVTGAGGLSLTPAPVYSCGHAPLDVADSGCTASFSFAGDANHTGSSDSKTYTIGKAASTTSVNVASATYDGHPHGATASVTGIGGLNQTLAVTYAGVGGTVYGPSASAPADAGDYQASADFAGDANHAPSGDAKAFTISKANPTVAATGNVCVYNANPCLGGGSAVGVNGEALAPVTIAYKDALGNLLGSGPVNAGSYQVAARFAGNANYNAKQSAAAAIIVNPATPTISVSGGPFTYDANGHEATCAATGVVNESVAGTCTFAYNGSAAAPVAAGTYAVSASFTSANPNYGSASGGGSVKVDVRPASVTPNAASKFLNEDDPALTGVLANFVAADGITATYARAPGEAPGAYPITATLTPTASLANYAITYNPASFSIIAVGLTGPSGPLAKGTAANVAATFANTGNQAGPKCRIAWDDGTATAWFDATNGGANWSCGGARTYAAAGVYEAVVTITDANTGTTDVSWQYVVVYDAGAGFVTGGGWILSPAGAYVAQPGLTGKANFGFVSKYQKGANVPSGDTEFQFQAAGFNFKSTVYEWLVIAGAKAQYKGSGTVNGAGDYGFLLTATDGNVSGGGGVDKFRIKVWSKADGSTVYDNMPGSDDIDASGQTALGGGSIVIHR